MIVSGVDVVSVVLVCPGPVEMVVRQVAELRAVAAPEVAVAVVARERPQVVVVDADAGRPALDAIAQLCEAVPVLSVSADHAAALPAVRAGATSHLAGRVAPRELAAALRRTAAGEPVFSAGLADVVLAGAANPAPRPALTQREGDVLRLVVDGLTARQIAARLVLSQRTVENHVQSVLRKAELHSRAALVRYAIENGLA